MGNSAEARLDKADRLDAKATKLLKKDPDSARELKDLARAARKSAIKQMKRKPPNRTKVDKERLVL